MARKGNTTAQATPGRDKYLALVRRFPLRRLRSDEELDEAIRMVHLLLDRERDAWEEDYLEVLSDLIERYEEAEHPIGEVSDAEMLQHLIEAKGVTQAQVAAATGIAESTISAILRGKRKLARRHLQPLADYFGVSPAVFLPDRPVGPKSR
jgi:HTH-type transcriptional regulator/antitoxin HigA